MSVGRRMFYCVVFSEFGVVGSLILGGIGRCVRVYVTCVSMCVCIRRGVLGGRRVSYYILWFVGCR